MSYIFGLLLSWTLYKCLCCRLMYTNLPHMCKASMWLPEVCSHRRPNKLLQNFSKATHQGKSYCFIMSYRMFLALPNQIFFKSLRSLISVFIKCFQQHALKVYVHDKNKRKIWATIYLKKHQHSVQLTWNSHMKILI